MIVFVNFQTDTKFFVAQTGTGRTSRNWPRKRLGGQQLVHIHVPSGTKVNWPQCSWHSWNQKWTKGVFLMNSCWNLWSRVLLRSIPASEPCTKRICGQQGINFLRSLGMVCGSYAGMKNLLVSRMCEECLCFNTFPKFIVSTRFTWGCTLQLFEMPAVWTHWLFQFNNVKILFQGLAGYQGVLLVVMEHPKRWWIDT